MKQKTSKVLLVTDRVDVLTEYELLDVKPLFDSLELTSLENIDYETFVVRKNSNSIENWWDIFEMVEI